MPQGNIRIVDRVITQISQCCAMLRQFIKVVELFAMILTRGFLMHCINYRGTRIERGRFGVAQFSLAT